MSSRTVLLPTVFRSLWFLSLMCCQRGGNDLCDCCATSSNQLLLIYNKTGVNQTSTNQKLGNNAINIWIQDFQTHLHLICWSNFIFGIQVVHNARDTERSSEAQQVRQVTKGAAEQDGTAKRSIHGAPDRWGSIGVFRRLSSEMWIEKTVYSIKIT